MECPPLRECNLQDITFLTTSNVDDSGTGKTSVTVFFRHWCAFGYDHHHDFYC